MLREYATFFRQFRERFETTGAIAPSSRFLARSMTRYLRQRPSDRSIRVLEIGPGTGAFTGAIVRHLQDGDRFDLVELNESFAALLKKRFSTEPAWQRVASFSQVHTLPLQEFQSEAPYDFVISGLPLNNFPADLVRDIFEHYFRHLRPEGFLSYFEYQFVRTVRTRIGRSEERTRLRAIDGIMAAHCRACRIRRDWVFANLPPAWAQHLTPSQSQTPQTTAPAT